MPDFIRTPDVNFAGLAGYPFAPHYLDYDGVRLHYLDEGPRGAPVALLMHGMPSWSYLYRTMIPKLVAAGYRCIAADHIGFGKSDKVTDEAWFSIAQHARAHRHLIQTLNLTNITLFCQDWGGPIGLAQAADMPGRFARLVIMNTWLHHESFVYTPEIRRWQEGWRPGGFFATNIPGKLTLGLILLAATGRQGEGELAKYLMGGEPLPLSPEAAGVRAAYDAPHAGMPSEAFAGPRRFPGSIPIDGHEPDNAATMARQFEALKAWAKPIHFIWGTADSVFTEDWGRQWAALYRQATFDALPGAGHFLQDTHGEEIVARFLERV